MLVVVLYSAYPQAARAQELAFRFGNVVSISVPSNWHYVPPAQPERMERTRHAVNVDFVPVPLGASSGYDLLSAQDTPLGTEPINRLVLSYTKRMPHQRTTLEAEFLRPSSVGSKAILDSADNMPNTLRSLKFASEVKVLAAKIVMHGKLFCESYVVQYRINTIPYESHNFVCPSEYGAIRLYLETAAPKPGVQSPLLTTIAATIAQ
jgi:hypothetical protein